MNMNHKKPKPTWEEQDNSQKTLTIINGITTVLFVASLVLQYVTKNNNFYVIGCLAVVLMAVSHAVIQWKKQRITSIVMLILAAIIAWSALHEVGLV